MDVSLNAVLVMLKVNFSCPSTASKVGRFASEEVVINLIHAKCLPVLLYCTESCNLLVRNKRSLEFTVTRSLMKLFQTSSATIIQDCQNFFHFLPLSYMIDIRTAKFLNSLLTTTMFADYLFISLNAVWIKKFIIWR